jgi:TRAP transporter TAXI family solute receptor
VKNLRIVCVALFGVLLTVSGARAADDLGLITGGEKGTYYRFGLDLQNLTKGRGFNLTVHPSRGSVENIYAVYQRPGVQLGIVQSDVLAFVSRVETDPVLKLIAKKTKMVFPLYNEEIHLVGRRDIASFDELAGKRVAIGRDGSGTYLTARLLFKLSDVSPAEMVPIDTGEALAALRAGRVDAMFYVAGYPVKLFTDDVTEADKLAVIPIANKSVIEFYPTVELPAGAYAWQQAAVPTVAVKSVLVSFDFRRKDCETVGRFASVIAKQMPWLAENGHPKWKVVDLDFPLRGWEQYDCVRKALGKPPLPGPVRTSGSPASNPVSDAIKNALGN